MIEEECMICRIDYDENDDVIVLPCNEKHFFHANCIKKWLKINGLCPVCRKRLENLLDKKNEKNISNNDPEDDPQIEFRNNRNNLN